MEREELMKKRKELIQRTMHGYRPDINKQIQEINKRLYELMEEEDEC